MPQENVDELRNLVNTRLAEKVPKAGDTRVISRSPDRAAFSLSVGDHSTKLDDFKRASQEITPATVSRGPPQGRSVVDTPFTAPAIMPDSCLPVEDRAGRIQLDYYRKDDEKRYRQEQPYYSSGNIDTALDEVAEPPLVRWQRVCAR